MQLNENLKISIFKKDDTKTIAAKDTFTHYWNNTEENFPDCSDIESYLSSYIDSGNYSWVEIQDTSRFVRSRILEATLTLNNSDRLSVDQVFIKVEYTDGSEIPQYYYGTAIDVMTNQNNPTNDYTLTLELDMWSTFGCKMHGLMKSESMTQHFLANRKMMARFKYKKLVDGKWVDSEEFIIGDPNYRLGINFMTQPWLLNTGAYDYPLIQATDDLMPVSNDIVGMSLVNWLKMNGCSDTNWNDWKNTGVISIIDCKKETNTVLDSTYTQKGNAGYVYNQNRISLKGTDFEPLIQDEMFNSNGKYRYMVVKFGSNNTWSYKLMSNLKEGDPGYQEQKDKIAAYNAAREKLAKYPDLQTLLSDVVLGGGKTCITTKKVKCQEVGSTKEVTTHLNGECVCLIPIPKGQFEELYLFYLNSHDKGIVLGDGTILGMVINDIPPSILASALRKYNEELNNHNMQTIGDKLSLHNQHTGTEYPFSWTSLELDGVWDWQDPKIKKSVTYNNQYRSTEHDWETTGWYEHKAKNGASTGSYVYSFRPSKSLTEEGYFIIKLAADDNSGNIWSWSAEDIGWYFPTMFMKDGYTSRRNVCAYLHFKGGDSWNQSKWEVIATGYDAEADSWTINPDFEQNDKIKDWVLDQNKLIVLTHLVPPSDWSYGKVYYSSGDPFTTIYIPDESKHYFPTIFHDFSYIPVTVARKNEGTMEGQSQWFKIFENMLTNEDTYKTNNRWSEPFLWGPQFYQWVYFTDGLSRITLTADHIDWFKTYNANWNVNLRVNMTSTTNLKLDIDDIINDNYPFSKSATELLINDPNKYPFTCEPYNNWYQQNAVSEATSKRAKDITNEYSRRKYPLSAGLNLFSSTVGGATAGGSTGTWQGAVIGGIAGLATGGISWGLGQHKLDLEIEQADKKWANEWTQQYGNLYGEPARIVSDGFTSGSLLYTPNGPGWEDSKQNFALFRMFTINPEARDTIGQDVFTSGLPYMKMCLYKDYDNRQKFNIVNFNLNDRNAIVNNYLKRELGKESLIFSQQQFIDWFKAKCKERIRLFKVKFDVDNLDELIESNIENNMKLS